jgi:uncharacterized OB-fold protein
MKQWRCPDCGEEFVPRVVTCSDCGAGLVWVEEGREEGQERVPSSRHVSVSPRPAQRGGGVGARSVGGEGDTLLRRCPDCGEDFLPHVVTCSDCGAGLEDVWVGEGDDEDPDSSLPPVVDDRYQPIDFFDVLNLEGISRALEDASVRTRIDLHSMDNRTRRSEARLSVWVEDLERARPILEKGGLAGLLGEDIVPITACPACGTEAKPGSPECGECGLSLAAEPETCATCGAERSPLRSRCLQCGARSS